MWFIKPETEAASISIVCLAMFFISSAELKIVNSF